MIAENQDEIGHNIGIWGLMMMSYPFPIIYSLAQTVKFTFTWFYKWNKEKQYIVAMVTKTENEQNNENMGKNLFNYTHRTIFTTKGGFYHIYRWHTPFATILWLK